MRSTSANILIGFLCVALLASLVPLRALDGRAEMLGREFIDLEDAVRLVQNILPVPGGDFLENVRDAVFALKAVASVETCLVREGGEFVLFDHLVFLISLLSQGLPPPRDFSTLDIGSDNSMSFFHVLDPPPPKNS